MGWYRPRSALLARDVPKLVEELSPRRSPNDGGLALHVAVRQMSARERRELLRWADGWVKQPKNNCLRARGDPRSGSITRLLVQLSRAAAAAKVRFLVACITASLFLAAICGAFNSKKKKKEKPV